MGRNPKISMSINDYIISISLVISIPFLLYLSYLNYKIFRVSKDIYRVSEALLEVNVALYEVSVKILHASDDLKEKL